MRFYQRTSIHNLTDFSLDFKGLWISVQALFKCTRGVPRLINLLCNKAMLLAYASGDFSISKQHIKMAFQDHENKAGMPGWKFWFATVLMTLTGILAMSQLGNNAL